MENYYIAAIALVLYILVLLSIPFRIKKYGPRDKAEKDKKFWYRQVSIFAFSLVLILLLFRLDFGLVSNIVLCGCGVMGAYMASKEMAAQKDEE